MGRCGLVSASVLPLHQAVEAAACKPLGVVPCFTPASFQSASAPPLHQAVEAAACKPLGVVPCFTPASFSFSLPDAIQAALARRAVAIAFSLLLIVPRSEVAVALMSAVG